MFYISVRSAATLQVRCARTFLGRCVSPRVLRQTTATLVRTLWVLGASSNASNQHAPISSTEAFKLYPIILYIVCKMIVYFHCQTYETKIIIKHILLRDWRSDFLTGSKFNFCTSHYTRLVTKDQQRDINGLEQ